MSKRIPDEIDNDDIEDAEELDLTEADEIASIINELDDEENVTVNVARQGKGKTSSFLFACGPRDYSLSALQEKLRDEYGGGEFRIRVYNKGRIAANRLVCVEKPLDKTPLAPVAPQNTGNDLTALIMSIQESTRAQMDSMREMVSAMQMKQMESQMELMKTLLGNKKEDSLQDLFKMLASSKALFGDDSAKKGNEIDVLLRGIELGKELGGNASDESTLQTAIKSLAPVVGELAKAGNAAQIGQAKTLQGPIGNVQQFPPTAAVAGAYQSGEKPAHVVRPVLAENAGEEKPAEIPANNGLDVILAILKKAAAKDADPEIYANFVIDQSDAETVYGIFSDNVARMFMAQHFTEESEALWFAEFCDLVLELAESDLQERANHASGQFAAAESGPHDNDHAGPAVPENAVPIGANPAGNGN